MEEEIIEGESWEDAGEKTGFKDHSPEKPNSLIIINQNYATFLLYWIILDPKMLSHYSYCTVACEYFQNPECT